MKYRILLLPILFFSTQLFAQTGPGGVGDATSNGLWLRADKIEQADNTAVPSWNDTSGNTNNATQAGSTKQPKYFSTSSLNNMPIIRFDGSNDEMAVADSPILDGTSGITFYTVLRPNNLSGGPKGILGKRTTYGVNSNYAYTWFFYSGNRLNLDVNTANNRFSTGSTTFSNNTNYLLGWDFDGSLPTSSRSGIRSGSDTIIRATESSISIPDSSEDLAIGALNVGYNQYLGADYAEIIHYNYALTPVDHILVQNYLSAKYAIDLSTNDLYDEDDGANGNYDYDVAGIGQLSSTDNNNDARGSGIVRISNPTDLNDNEFLIWGHDNGTQQAIETTDVPATVEARFERVWRVSEVNTSASPTDVGAIDISFDLTGLGTVIPSDLRLLVDTDNDGLFSDETPISGATNARINNSRMGNVYGFSGVTAIENNLRFTLGTINVDQTILPIELVQFTTTLQDNNTVLLNWETRSEVNNDYFSVERSKNGIDWTELEQINGAGNSSTLRYYSTIDPSPLQGISYYRLKQTDFNETVKYSQIHRIDIERTKVQIYPNPTSDQVHLKGSNFEVKDIQIFNSLGQELTKSITMKEVSKGQFIIHLGNLSSGVYYLTTKTTTSKIYKQ